VTNAQYAAFLNSVAATDTHDLYDPNMGSDARGGISRGGAAGRHTYVTKANMADKPVNFVTFWDAARFANWLTNGQPTGPQGDGTTEDGMYDLDGVTNPANGSVTRLRDFGSGENGVAVTSENEWYKAAYYDPGSSGPSGDYWLFPTRSNTLPDFAMATGVGDVSNPGPNVANYDSGADWNGQDGNVTTVGSAGAASYYGTFDQGGNVDEWNDEIISGLLRGLRGGSLSSDSSTLQSSGRDNLDPVFAFDDLGFRVSSLAPIPEPSAAAAISGVLGMLMALLRRKGRRKRG
jgi:formylglycine-generating enzyme required for sulfatase activity